MFRAVNDPLGKEVLKGVSRSFYLTLRLLPEPMRRATSLGYLLARTSDTLADTTALPLKTREQCLGEFHLLLRRGTGFQGWPASLLRLVPDERERRLLESSGLILDGLRGLPEGEASLVREVLEIIISGQALDLARFAGADRDRPMALPDDAALEDYAWRVAGCVGAFWTKLGFLTLGDRFSNAPQSDLIERGIAFGKGLQLVNILRDLAADLAVGRCYLPVVDPRDPIQILASHDRWLRRTEEWLEQGKRYAGELKIRRLRAATLLPALLAYETLVPLRAATWDVIQRNNKVPRKTVYALLLRAFMS